MIHSNENKHKTDSIHSHKILVNNKLDLLELPDIQSKYILEDQFIFRMIYSSHLGVVFTDSNTGNNVKEV